MLLTWEVRMRVSDILLSVVVNLVLNWTSSLVESSYTWTYKGREKTQYSSEQLNLPNQRQKIDTPAHLKRLKHASVNIDLVTYMYYTTYNITSYGKEVVIKQLWQTFNNIKCNCTQDIHHLNVIACIVEGKWHVRRRNCTLNFGANQKIWLQWVLY